MLIHPLSFLLFLITFLGQTHTTPVLLNYKDRAELAGKEYKSLSSVLEGIVILEKQPADDEHVHP